MKTVRIALLTMSLLVGATARSVPTVESDPQTIANADGPCYLINGIWVCEP
jgi:hypothetical protein